MREVFLGNDYSIIELRRNDVFEYYVRDLREVRTITEKQRQEYIRFMCDPQNICRCDRCPENRDMDGWQRRLPCGQQNCWVEVHCEPERFSR